MGLRINDWESIKSFVTARERSSLHYVELSHTYELVAIDGMFQLEMTLLKNTTEATDFENNFKNNANQPIGDLQFNSNVQLKVSEEVESSLEVADTYIPPAGSKVIVLSFKSELPYSSSSAAKLIWDYGGNEEILWSARGSGKADHEIIIDTDKTDGVKKLAVTCDNAADLSTMLSAVALLKVFS